KDLLLLKMAGPVPQFVLAGGAKAEELKGRSDLPDNRLRVTGRLHPSHADRPPGLTVERWALIRPTNEEVRFFVGQEKARRRVVATCVGSGPCAENLAAGLLRRAQALDDLKK